MPGLVPGAARILQCRGMPYWNAVLRLWRMSGFAFSRNGLGIWPHRTIDIPKGRPFSDPPKSTFAIALLLEQARTRRGCLLLQKNTLQPPIVVPES